MVKIYLEPVFIKSRSRMSVRMASQAELIVAEYQAKLLEAWREIHG